MLSRAAWQLVWLLLLCAAVSRPAAAQQSGADELARAEEAYLGVDFEGARDHALAALRAGGHEPAQVVRVYQLLGIASSALGDEDAAREYFVRMLGLDPDATLDASVPPRLRSPYLEARGQWAARPTRLGVETGLDRPSSSLRVQLRDPVDMARRVRIGARLEGEAEFETREYRAQTALAAELEGAREADRVEYYVEVLDMHGNTILSDGTAFRPRVVGRTATASGPGDGAGGGGSIFEEPVLWIVIGLALAAAGAITAAIVVDQHSRVGVQTGVTIGLE